MRGHRFNRIVAGTALALVLAMANGVAGGQLENDRDIEALIPVPEPADVPPPTIADSGGVTGTVKDSQGGETQPANPAASAAKEPAAPAVNTIPVPDLSEVPPPTIKDVQDAKMDALPAADVAVAEKLRELVTTKLDRYMERKNRSAIEAFYAARNFAPLWIENGAAAARAKAVIARLRQADADGLDPSDYRIPDFAAAATPDALADADLKLSATALTYARHAQTGRIHFSRVSADIIFNPVYPEAAGVLTHLADAADAGEVLGSS